MENITQTLNLPNNSERNIAMIAHLGTFLFPILAPLLIYVLKEKESEYIAAHARESLNFQITMLIAVLVSALAMFIVIGFIALPFFLILNLVTVIIASVKAYRGETYNYPLSLRILK